MTKRKRPEDRLRPGPPPPHLANLVTWVSLTRYSGTDWDYYFRTQRTIEDSKGAPLTGAPPFHK